MKIYIIKIAAIMLIFAGSSYSCNDSTHSSDSKISDISGVWVCNPESNITITLTFDSGTVLVNTYPKTLNNGISDKQYLFNDGDKYIVRGDTLFYVYPDHNASVAEYGFEKKMISSNKMELQSYGRVLIALYTWVTDYSFQRKKIN